MGVTLRQLQRMLSRSKKTDNRVQFATIADAKEFQTFAMEFFRRGFQIPEFHRGAAVERCTCTNCQQTKLVIDRAIDRLARKNGHNMTLEELVRLKKKPPPPQTQSSPATPSQAPSGGFSPPPPKPDSSAPPQQGSANSQQPAAESPQPAQRPEPPTPPPAPAPPKPKTEREKLADEEKKLRDEIKEIEKRKAAAKKRGSLQASAMDVLQKKAKKTLRDTRKKMSKISGALGAEVGPSLQARRRAAGTHGRLRAVSPQLRNQTAELINQLMCESGAAGDRLTPIPVLSTRKIVKRMLVRRPLGNAFKEDSNSGRPVTLFLPDVSPSCARVAQEACDVANAAGYAGVSGSDVLVFPHSNGIVEPEYVPWFNGRPYLVSKANVKALFTDVVEGRSRYDIRVVVAIGDHDAVEMYRGLAAMKKVLRVVWLHNIGRSGPTIAAADPYKFGRTAWSLDEAAKTTLVYGCRNQKTILAGLKLALSNKR